MSLTCTAWLRWRIFVLCTPVTCTHAHATCIHLPRCRCRHILPSSPTSLVSGDVFVFIKFRRSPAGTMSHVYLWKGSHSSCLPLLAWSRKLKADTQSNYGKFISYQEMAQGCETPEFIALFPSFFVVYEGRLADMFSLSSGTRSGHSLVFSIFLHRSVNSAVSLF